MRNARDRRNKVRLCVTSAAACLALAAVGAIIAGPGTALAAKPVAPAFDVTASGDVFFNGTYKDGEGTKNGQIKLYFPGPTWDVSFFVTSFGDDGSACFSESTPVATLIRQTKDERARVTYWFNALGTDGTTEITYMLDMVGEFDDPNNFPPATGTSNGMFLMQWELTTEGKRDKKIACTGEGFFDVPVEVVVVRTN